MKENVCKIFTIVIHTYYSHPTDCGPMPADIMFLLDSSGSVGTSNFDKQKQFVSRFVDSFNIAPNAVRVGLVTYSTTTANRFNLDRYTTKAALKAAINAVPYTGQNTYTGKALQYIKDRSFQANAGDRPGVVNVLIVLTDGQSNDHSVVVTQSGRIHAANIKTFAIGIGSGITRSELDTIATDSKHVFTVSNFNALNTLQAELKKTTCEGESLKKIILCRAQIPV